MMAKQVDRKSREWTRCSEGFSEFTSKDGKKEAKKRPATDSYNRGNIFEKLALQSEEETSQNITWSSNDSEEEVVNVQVAKKQKKQITPKSAPPKRRTTPRTRQKFTPDDVDIQSDSDTEKGDNLCHTVPTPQSSSTSSKSQDASIQGYDSGPDSLKEERPSSPNDQKSGSLPGSQLSPSISESLSTGSPVTQTGTGVKASEWVKSLQLKTPSKSENQTEKPELEDSAKKKKKHTRGGLAEQLSRLQARDKSSVRMWSHQKNKPALSQDSNSISLEVIGYESLYSMQLMKCVECGSSSVTSEAASDQTGDKADAAVKETGDKAVAAVKETKLVMFPASQTEQLNVQIGTKFTIFPPWQQLELNDGKQMLLCTKYCQVLSQPEVTDTADTENQGTSLGLKTDCVVKASWNCPCVQGLCRSQTLCPAYQFPSVPGLIQDSTTESSNPSPEKKDSNSNVVKAIEKSASHLHTISSSKSDRRLSQPRSSRSLTKLAVCDSILESIEASRNTISNTGDGTVAVVCFKGHVHRAVIYKEQGQDRCRLLVEDGVGTVCEVCLVADTMSQLNMDVHSCEGQSFQFSGLSVRDRVTRDRDSPLFTMIDSVWSGTIPTAASQDSEQSADIIMHQDSTSTPTAPGFCYSFHEDPTSSAQVGIQPCQGASLHMKEVVYKQLSDIQNMLEGVSCRCSCVAKLIHVQSESKKCPECVLYVTDRSMRKEQVFVRIRMQSGCNFTHNDWLNSGDSNIIVLRDLFMDKGEITADGYCNISRVSARSKLKASLKAAVTSLARMSVVLGEVKEGVAEKELCSIKGVISEVDEDSAYSWEACTHCGGDQLQSDASEGKLKCSTCKEVVDEPETKMKMEVMVKCDSLESHVKIDLLQTTIEKVLPMDEDDDEGYELSSVLDKHIGPLTCIVEAVGAGGAHDTMLLKEIALLK